MEPFYEPVKLVLFFFYSGSLESIYSRNFLSKFPLLLMKLNLSKFPATVHEAEEEEKRVVVPSSPEG